MLGTLETAAASPVDLGDDLATIADVLQLQTSLGGERNCDCKEHIIEIFYYRGSKLLLSINLA